MYTHIEGFVGGDEGYWQRVWWGGGLDVVVRGI